MLEAKKYLTVQEVARLLRVTPGRVRQFLAEGRLPSVKVGTVRLIALEDVQRFARYPRPTGRPKSIA